MKFIYTKTFAALAGTLVIVALFLFLDSRGFLDPFRKAALYAPRPVVTFARFVVTPLKTFVTTLYTLRQISQDNAVLTGKVFELQQKLVLFNEYKQENDILRKELGFLQKSSLNLAGCSVLAIDPQGVTDSMVLDCGQNQGIHDGSAVIAQGFLVGTVIHSGMSTSTVLLITNTNSSVDAQISGNKTEGVVKGSFGSGIVFDLIPQHDELQERDIIVTAGITNKIPKNIVIGEVGETLSRPNDLFKKAALISPVNFHDLQFVFVVRD